MTGIFKEGDAYRDALTIQTGLPQGEFNQAKMRVVDSLIGDQFDFYGAEGHLIQTSSEPDKKTFRLIKKQSRGSTPE